MKVHITATPEYSLVNIQSVVEVLQVNPGELEFKDGNPLTSQQIALKIERFQNPTEISVLRFNEFFDICQVYRSINSIPNDEFVIVLSTIENDRNWFSAFSNKNIFIDATGWEYLTEADGKYGIAYQVIENIFQSLSGINISDVKNEPNIHKRSIGCINDLNGEYKPDVILKLRMGFICMSCQKRATENGVTKEMLIQFQDIIQYLRDELMNNSLITPEIQPDKIVIQERGKITIGTKPVKIEALPCTLFIYFLENLDGIIVGTMSERMNDVLTVYRKIRRGGEVEKIKKLCESYDNLSTYFLTLKWDLNKTLVTNLGKQKSEFYIITKGKSGKRTKYKINLTPDYISIDPRF